MKNLLLILLVAFASSVSASEYPKLEARNGKSFIVDFKDWSNSDLHIFINNNDGVVVYSERLKAKSLNIKKYVLNQLPIGNYSVRISSDKQDIYYGLSVKNDEIVIDAEKEVFFAPTIKSTGDLLDVNILSLDNNVTMSLLNESGQELYNVDQKDGSIFQRRLNLKNLKTGNYYLNIQVGNHFYSERIIR